MVLKEYYSFLKYQYKNYKTEMWTVHVKHVGYNAKLTCLDLITLTLIDKCIVF